MQNRCFIFLIGVLLGDIVQSVQVKLLQTLPTDVREIESQKGLWEGVGEELVAEENIYQMRFENEGTNEGKLRDLILKHCNLKEENDPLKTGVLVVFIDGGWEVLDNFALEITTFEETDWKKGSIGILKEKPEHEVNLKGSDPSNKSPLCITYLNRNRLNKDILYRVSWPSFSKAVLDTEKVGQIHYFTIRLPNIRKAFGNFKTRRKCALDGPARVLAPRQHKQFYRTSGLLGNLPTYEIANLDKTSTALFALLAKFPLKPNSTVATATETNTATKTATETATETETETKTETESETISADDRYTFVLVDDALRLAQTGKGKLNDLSKHCILAVIAEYVYCAGEFLVTGEGDEKVLHLLNNSGSYQAKFERMKILEQLLRSNFVGFNLRNLVIDLNPLTATTPSPLLANILKDNAIAPLSLDGIILES